jgi:hypothetical protein
MFHPAWKAAGYITVGGVVHARGESAVWSSLRALWMRVVDFRAHPEFTEAFADAHRWMRRDPDSGAILIGKAPEEVTPPVGTLDCVWACSCSFWSGVGRAPPPCHRELRAGSLVVASVPSCFSSPSRARSEQTACASTKGICSICSRSCPSRPWSRCPSSTGARACSWWPARCSACAAAYSLGVGGVVTAWWLSVVPLALSSLPGPRSCRGVLAECPDAVAEGELLRLRSRPVGWGLGVHLGDDLRTSRAVREHNATYLELTRERLPQGAALLAYSARDAFAPMIVTHRLLLIDPSADRSASAPVARRGLARAWTTSLRVAAWGLPEDLFELALAGRQTVDVLVRASGEAVLVEVLPRSNDCWGSRGSWKP